MTTLQPERGRDGGSTPSLPPVWRGGTEREERTARSPGSPDSMPRVRVAADAPYFVTEDGEGWTPIGLNDAVTWPELAPFFRRRDLAGIERHDSHVLPGPVCGLSLTATTGVSTRSRIAGSSCRRRSTMSAFRHMQWRTLPPVVRAEGCAGTAARMCSPPECGRPARTRTCAPTRGPARLPSPQPERRDRMSTPHLAAFGCADATQTSRGSCGGTSSA